MLSVLNCKVARLMDYGKVGFRSIIELLRSEVLFVFFYIIIFNKSLYI